MKYFDTEHTSDDYDLLTNSLAEANKQNFQLLQDKLELESDMLELKEINEELIRKINKLTSQTATK